MNKNMRELLIKVMLNQNRKIKKLEKDLNDLTEIVLKMVNND